MTKIKVNINKPDPTPQEIKKYKNYNTFVSDYQKLHTPNGIYRMWRKDPVKFSMIIVFLVLLLLYVLGEWGTDKKMEHDEKSSPSPAKTEQVE